MLSACRNKVNEIAFLSYEKSFEIDASESQISRIMFFAVDSNVVLLGDASSTNALRICIKDEGPFIEKRFKTSDEDWLMNVAISGEKSYFIYNDSIICNGAISYLLPHDSIFYYRNNSMFCPVVNDSGIFIENNHKPCLENPVYCRSYCPEVFINLKTKKVSKVPIEIKIDDIGAPFMKADVYSFRAAVNNKHYYSFGNSSKIFIYDIVEKSLSIKNARSKYQNATFFDCAEEDTSDYVSYLIQNQICSPTYSAIVYNPEQRVLLRLFNKEQDLFTPKNEINDLRNRDNYLQVLSENAELQVETPINRQHFSHFFISYANKILFIQLIIAENGKPKILFHRYSLDLHL